MMLSEETRDGLHITSKHHQLQVCDCQLLTWVAVLLLCELGSKLLKMEGVEYLLSEVFSQDPLEVYFSRQRHNGRSNDNPSVLQFHHITLCLLSHKGKL